MTANTLRLALSQLNVTVGDLDGNTAKIIAAIGEARDAGAGMVAVFIRRGPWASSWAGRWTRRWWMGLSTV